MFSTVFVIDDSPIDRTLTTVIIQKKALAKNVVGFSSGEDALAYIAENRNDPSRLPEMIFLDIHMPTMDGFGFLDSYLEQEMHDLGRPLIFIVSSSTFDSDHKKLGDYSIVNRFIPKPLTFDALTAAMESL
ncbi:hypothetical protein GCM10023093_05200 [Nemorincola caseinilytica]|uniref:Response regulatory domain-containing protein n=1 Tax=Nemorincola caseinilytica TaxID=2054315 RepID=A0ABP8N4D3_9BACT